MRHRIKGRKLGRNGSHRKAMFMNMANSLIKSLRVDEEEQNAPQTPGRIIIRKSCFLFVEDARSKDARTPEKPLPL